VYVIEAQPDSDAGGGLLWADPLPIGLVVRSREPIAPDAENSAGLM
jgi:hypothetical protein